MINCGCGGQYTSTYGTYMENAVILKKNNNIDIIYRPIANANELLYRVNGTLCWVTE